MSHEPWSNAERESLYNAAIDHINELIGSDEVFANDDVIENINDAHEGNRDNLSILCKLSEMGFLRRSGKKIHRISFSKMNLYGYGAHPVYKSFTADEGKVAQDVLDKHWHPKTSEPEIVTALASALNISDTHAQCWLVKKGIVLLKNLDMTEDDSPVYAMAVNPNYRHNPQGLQVKTISKEVKKAINSLRSKVAGLYNSHAQPSPALIMSNDGTGTGKSYSVLDQFVDNTHPNGTGRDHRNLVFITPQKAQIKFDEDTTEKAKAKGIKFIGFYSKDDATNLDFKHWVNKTITGDLFAGWIKDLRNHPLLKDLIPRFEGAINSLKGHQNKLARVPADIEKYLFDRILEDIKHAQSEIRDCLKKMACAAMNGPKVDPKLGGNHYFKSTDAKDVLIASILDHVTPLERAKYEPTVLMSTTDKFIHTTPVFKHTKEGFVLVDFPFDYVIGQKKLTKSEEGVKDANGKHINEQMRFIRDEFFKTDEENYFLKHDISFTLVVDEVHIAHDKILAARHKTLFDHTIKIPHVLNTVYRIINRVKHSEESTESKMVLQQSYKDFYDDLTYLFDNKCDSKFKIDELLAMFQANLGDMSIDGRDVEQVIGICKNVFSVTPKRFFYENNLKKIRFRSLGNNSECRIYFSDTAEEDDSDNNPSMHDLMQVTLCVFAACSRLQDNKISKWFSHNSINNQNSLLTEFINIARNNRGCVDSLFCRVDAKNLNVDEFFTYFTPKIVFSIEKLDDLPLPPADLEDAIHVGFRAELFEELPEVSLMRILYNTQNTIITLSATSGFHRSYSNDYGHDVLAKFGESPNHSNLGFKCITRSAADVATLSQLRDARRALRNVEFSTFEDTSTGRVSAVTRGKDFEETLRAWCVPLVSIMKGRNKYRTMELKRNIETLLMACWDAKDTLALSLTNDFSRTLREYLEKTPNPLGRPTYPIEGCKKIVEMRPFNNGVTVRVVLFDADLNKALKDETHMNVDRTTKVAFFSSYKTAGTGLNLFTKDMPEDLEQDFERLVLINTPFYSTIKTPAGIDTALNYLLALKIYASSGGMSIASFDQMLKSPEFKRLMMDAHRLSILKDIMQAIGRVERRDTNINTEIFITDTLMEDISLQFSLINTPENSMLISSMSMLNKSLMDFCLEEMAKKSFATDVERKAFSDQMAEDGAEIDSFMKGFLKKKVLKNARTGDIESAKLNDLLRSMDCITNPERFIANIKAHPLIKGDEYYESVVDKFYIKMPKGQEHIKLCWSKGVDRGLTDYLGGSQVYRPYENAVPEYTSTLSNSKDGTPGLINNMMDVGNVDRKLPLPHPAMIPLIKGNVGEDLFRSFMALYGIHPMKLEALFTEFSPKVYELYDSFVLKGKTLLCIDVKFWSSFLENAEQSAELVSKAASKRITLMEICEAFGYTPTFIYVNAHYDRNAHNKMQEFTKGLPIHYMNLFKVMTHYKASPKFRESSTVEDAMQFNESLINVMTQ